MIAEAEILPFESAIPFRFREQMTREAAQRTRDEIKTQMREEGRCKILARASLLYLHEGKGWKSLVYSTHLECAAVEFGINTRQRYDQMVEAAKNDRILREQAETRATMVDANIGESAKIDVNIPERQSRELSKVQEDRRLDVLLDARKDGPATAAKIAESAERMNCKIEVNKKPQRPRDDAGNRALREDRVNAKAADKIRRAIRILAQAQDDYNGIGQYSRGKRIADLRAELEGVI